MKLLFARRIAAVILSTASLFALGASLTAPRLSSASPIVKATTTTTAIRVTLVSSSAKPKWYSPIFDLGPKARSFFTCVLFRESRSTWTHPNTHDGDRAYPGQYGIYQFTWPSPNNAWDAYVFPKLHVEPRYASAFQQSEGAAIIWKMGDEIQTWTFSDGCTP